MGCGGQLGEVEIVQSENRNAKQINSGTTGRNLTPGIAALLSVLLVGLGQILMGQQAKGVTMLVVACLLGFVTFGVAAVVVWPVSAVDAYRIAKKLESGQAVGEWEFF